MMAANCIMLPCPMDYLLTNQQRTQYSLPPEADEFRLQEDNMASRYAIGPSIGAARLGNAPDEFYLEPDKIGGLPIACDAHGNVLTQSGKPVSVRQFKDPHGRVKRQGAYFH